MGFLCVLAEDEKNFACVVDARLRFGATAAGCEELERVGCEQSVFFRCAEPQRVGAVRVDDEIRERLEGRVERAERGLEVAGTSELERRVRDLGGEDLDERKPTGAKPVGE